MSRFEKRIEQIQSPLRKHGRPASSQAWTASVLTAALLVGVTTAFCQGQPTRLAGASQDEIIWETLGIRYVPSMQEYGGVRVVCVRADSPAAKRGIATGDTIVGIGQRHIESSNDMHWIAQNWRTLQAEESVMMEVIRAGIRYVADVSLDSKPLKVFCKQ
ncbi:MAG: PDZ domain-containing protein [Planctomycetaceae bacterium]|nr:PDZ domain-containing protein [Planctomycetaceae bacterium]